MTVAEVGVPRTVTPPTPVYLLSAASILSGAVTLFVPGLLTGPAAMNGSARGTALVVLLGGAPLLVAAYRRSRRGSLVPLTLATGAAAYLLYNAVLLVLGTPLNRAFLLYEAMLGLAIWAVIGLVRETWARARGMTVRAGPWVAGFVLGIVALNLAAWFQRLVPALLSGDTHELLAGTGLTTNPVYVQDLAFWLPVLAWIGIGMWQAHGPRTALGAAALCYWVLEAASVAVDQWWGHHADPTSSVASVSAVPLFVVVGLVTLVALRSALRALATTAVTPLEGPRARHPVPGGARGD